MERSNYQKYLAAINAFLISQVSSSVYAEGDLYVVDSSPVYEHIKLKIKELEKLYGQEKRTVHFDDLSDTPYVELKLTYTPVYKRLVSKKQIKNFCAEYSVNNTMYSQIINPDSFANDSVKLYVISTEKRIRYSYNDFNKRAVVKNQYNIGIASVVLCNSCTVFKQISSSKKINRRECLPNVMQYSPGVIFEMNEAVFNLYQVIRI